MFDMEPCWLGSLPWQHHENVQGTWRRHRLPVLDVGCGVGDNSLELAARGFDVVGIDLSQTAVAAAKQTAEERGLDSVTFIQGDVTKLDDDATFNSVLDCTLFTPCRSRSAMGTSVPPHRTPRCRCWFTTDALPADSPFPVPNLVTKGELQQAVSAHWDIDGIDPAFVYVQLPDVPNLPAHSFEVYPRGRVKLPAFLLSAHEGS